jgi:molybdenum transport protein
MLYISESTIDNFIKEDVPFIDLTTIVLGIGDQKGRLEFINREDAVMACSEEVVRIFEKLGISTTKFTPTGCEIRKGEVILAGEGSTERLHKAWKVSLNILEYCCGIATRTKGMVEKAQKVNPNITIATTRKSFPGTKELTIKAIMAGGAFPHRLGLSETVLVFKQHLNFLGGIPGLLKIIDIVKAKACEKKVIVEVDNIDEAIELVKAGVDGIQFDKVDPISLEQYVKKLKAINPNVTIIGAGGINETNIEEYAATGIDAVATTSVYFGKPVDIGAKMVKL